MTRLALIFALFASISGAQTKTPEELVSWSLSVATTRPGEKGSAELKVEIESGWHIYATTIKTKQNALKLALAESPAIGRWQGFQPEPLEKELFGEVSEVYKDSATFVFEMEVAHDAPAESPLSASATFAVCNDQFCFPARTMTAESSLKTSAGAEIAAALPAGYGPIKVWETATKPAAVETAAAAPETAPATQDQGLVSFAAVAFGFGLLAIFTPCVFPMIPITMSYFVSTQSGSPKASVIQASTFCLGVIVLFTGMGAAVSALLGPFGMSQLGANVWVNLFIAVIFFAFGASLLGAFEITMPSGVVNSLNNSAQGGGTIATLTMGLVFALASFACTGPVVGALLAGSVSGGSLAWPIFGMLMFSAGLALPFFFLALFPSYLNKLPKSGGWLARTKIVMGFVIIAVGIKYLSNVDQIFAWELLSRERFLAAWVVLFSLAGLYLLGQLKLEHDQDEGIGLGRLSSGAAFLIFAVSLIPGMFGGRLGDLDAYVPAGDASFLASGGSAPASKWIKDDYQAALAEAESSGKAVFLNFTGYTCTNCKWMKANIFTDPEIAAVMGDLVLAELYTDGKAGQEIQQLQLDKFKTAAIPFYAIVDADERVIATFPGRTGDASEFLAFVSEASSSGLSAANLSVLP